MGEFISEQPEKGAEQSQKPPFFHSDKFNDVLRKSRKEVSSRYKSSPPPTILVTRRYPSPDISRTTSSSISLPKRPHSTERGRPSSTPASPRTLPPSNDIKLLYRKATSISHDILWPSTRQSRHNIPLDSTILKSPLNIHRKGIETPLRSQLNVTYTHTRQSKDCSFVSSTLPKNKYPTPPGGGFSQNRPPTLERVNKLLQKFDTRTPNVDIFSSSGGFKSASPIMRTQTMPILGSKIAEEFGGQKTKAFNPSQSTWQNARIRQSCSSSQLNQLNSSSVLGFVDITRRKKCSNHLEYVHHLRLLSNRHLQWQYVNAQAYRRSSLQKVMSEKTLCDAWTTLQPLWDSVKSKTTYLRWLRLTLRLKSLLNEQLTCLDDWICHRTQYDHALDGATEDLRAVALLPVIGVKVEIAALEPVLRSAMDLMRAMESQGTLHTMVEVMKCLVRELAEVGSKEKMVVGELGDELASIAYLQAITAIRYTHSLI